jgi:ABC-type nitrate/sulfonate/bicarbonate transport system substrate-binding protein
MMTSPESLRVVAFKSMSALQLLAAQQRSYFSKRGRSVDIEFASQSLALRRGLATGTYDIAQTAADNAVAMVENDGTDVVIVTGGDNGFNSFIIQDGLRELADFRGRALVVDAPDTGFALVAYQILKNAGLAPGGYAIKPVGSSELRLWELHQDPANGGAILGLPFSLQAVAGGLRKAGNAVDFIGPYLSSATFVRRAWLRDHADTVVRYIAAHIEGLRWLLSPESKDEVVALISSSLAVPADQADESYRQALNGFSPDAEIDREGFEEVLRLRSEFGSLAGKKLGPIEKYLDLACWTLARTELDGTSKKLSRNDRTNQVQHHSEQ